MKSKRIIFISLILGILITLYSILSITREQQMDRSSQLWRLAVDYNAETITTVGQVSKCEPLDKVLISRSLFNYLIKGRVNDDYIKGVVLLMLKFDKCVEEESDLSRSIDTYGALTYAFERVLYKRGGKFKQRRPELIFSWMVHSVIDDNKFLLSISEIAKERGDKSKGSPISQPVSIGNTKP